MAWKTLPPIVRSSAKLSIAPPWANPPIAMKAPFPPFPPIVWLLAKVHCSIVRTSTWLSIAPPTAMPANPPDPPTAALPLTVVRASVTVPASRLSMAPPWAGPPLP